jgi:hypothetical protein
MSTRTLTRGYSEGLSTIKEMHTASVLPIRLSLLPEYMLPLLSTHVCQANRTSALHVLCLHGNEAFLYRALQLAVAQQQLEGTMHSDGHT